MKAIMMRSQRGITLISTLVGLAISMVVTVGMLMVFKNVASTTLAARESSNADGKYIASALTASLAMQEAGYGVTSPQPGVQLIAISSATMTSNVLSGTADITSPMTGNAMVWEVLSGGVLQCAGLYAPSAGGLQSLPAVNCTGASTWNTLTWAPVILVPSPALASDSDKLDRNTPIIFKITATTQVCNPPGITRISGNVLASLTATNKAGDLYTNLSTAQCLSNFLAP